MGRLRWIDVAGEGGLLHYRQFELREDSGEFHSHDFPEMFWVEDGSGRHFVNGELAPLSKGAIVLMRPSDSHGYRDLRGGSMRITNLAYSPEARRHILKRYPIEAKPLFDPPGRLPFSAKPPSPAFDELSVRARELAFGKASLAALDGFLLDVIRLLSGGGAPGVSADEVPDWLRAACVKAMEQAVFSKGVPALVSLCGRSPEHVSREFMRHFGVTPTDYVNRIRLDYAAARLRTASVPVKEVAMECGWNDLSFFHRLFLRRHGVSPRRYSLAFRRRLV